MEWRDEGILLRVAGHGETGAVVDVLTRAHGRHSGHVHGGQGRRLAPVLQPGAQLALEWRARLEDHLGNYRIEPMRTRAPALMADRAVLAGFNAMSALLLAFLPEREADEPLYEASHDLVEALVRHDCDWPGTYARWEIVFLAALGFGLQLDRCAATGSERDLAWVSPRSGRAVCRQAGGPWADKLLPLAPFLVGEEVMTMSGVRSSMRMTEWFLVNRVCPAMGVEALPEARMRLMRILDRYELAPCPPRDAEGEARNQTWNRRLGIGTPATGAS